MIKQHTLKVFIVLYVLLLVGGCSNQEKEPTPPTNQVGKDISVVTYNVDDIKIEYQEDQIVPIRDMNWGVFNTFKQKIQLPEEVTEFGYQYTKQICSNYPDIRVESNGAIIPTDMYWEEVMSLGEIVNHHNWQLTQYGVDVCKIRPYDVVYDVTPSTGTDGGYYVSVGTGILTYNEHNYTRPTIVIDKHIHGNRFQNMHSTYIHEFGHHIGFEYLHKGYNYRWYKELVGGEYTTLEDMDHYYAEWRSIPYEQFAESYVELFVSNYTNHSAVPNLESYQEEEFINKLIEIGEK